MIVGLQLQPKEAHHNLYAVEVKCREDPLRSGECTVIDAADPRAKKSFVFDIMLPTASDTFRLVVQPTLELLIQSSSSPTELIHGTTSSPASPSIRQAVFVVDGATAVRHRSLLHSYDGLVPSAIRWFANEPSTECVRLSAVELDDHNQFVDLLSAGNSVIPTVVEDTNEQSVTTIESCTYEDVTSAYSVPLQRALDQAHPHRHLVFSVAVRRRSGATVVAQFVSFSVVDTSRGIKSTRVVISNAASLIESRCSSVPFTTTKLSFLLKPALLGKQPGVWLSALSVREDSHETFKEAFAVAQIASRVHSSRLGVVSAHLRTAVLQRSTLIASSTTYQTTSQQQHRTPKNVSSGPQQADDRTLLTTPPVSAIRPARSGGGGTAAAVDQSVLRVDERLHAILAEKPPPPMPSNVHTTPQPHAAPLRQQAFYTEDDDFGYNGATATTNHELEPRRTAPPQRTQLVRATTTTTTGRRNPPQPYSNSGVVDSDNEEFIFHRITGGPSPTPSAATKKASNPTMQRSSSAPKPRAKSATPPTPQTRLPPAAHDTSHKPTRAPPLDPTATPNPLEESSSTSAAELELLLRKQKQKTQELRLSFDTYKRVMESVLVRLRADVSTTTSQLEDSKRQLRHREKLCHSEHGEDPHTTAAQQKQHLADANAKVGSLTAELTQLRDELANAKASWRTQRAELMSSNDSLQNEVHTLLQRLHEYEITPPPPLPVAPAEPSGPQHQQAIDDLTLSLSDAQNRNTELQALIASLRRDLDVSQQQHQRALSRCSELELRCQQFEEQEIVLKTSLLRSEQQLRIERQASDKRLRTKEDHSLSVAIQTIADEPSDLAEVLRRDLELDLIATRHTIQELESDNAHLRKERTEAQHAWATQMESQRALQRQLEEELRDSRSAWEAQRQELVDRATAAENAALRSQATTHRFETLGEVLSETSDLDGEEPLDLRAAGPPPHSRRSHILSGATSSSSSNSAANPRRPAAPTLSPSSSSSAPQQQHRPLTTTLSSSSPSPNRGNINNNNNHNNHQSSSSPPIRVRQKIVPTAVKVPTSSGGGGGGGAAARGTTTTAEGSPAKATGLAAAAAAAKRTPTRTQAQGGIRF